MYMADRCYYCRINYGACNTVDILTLAVKFVNYLYLRLINM